MFRIRLDQNPSMDQITIIQSVRHICEPYDELLTVHHILPHGNPHVHVYVKTDQKEPCIRQRIKRLGFVASNFSLKKCDENRKDEYIQYLFNKKHDNHSTIYDTHNIDSEYLHRLQIQAEKYHDEYQTNTNTKRNSKPSIFSLAQEIKARLIEINTTINTLQVTQFIYPEYHIIYEQAIEEAINVCHKYNQGFDQFYLRKLIITALSLIDQSKKTIIQRMMVKEFS